jgi:hypothetical protein
MPFAGLRKKRISLGDPLKLACLLGIFFSLVLSGCLVFFGFYLENSFPGGVSPKKEDPFYRALKEFDARLASSQDEKLLKALDKSLNKLEKKGLQTEAWLSILKRRRLLAAANPRFIEAYQKSAQKAAAAFPFSEPLAILAIDALLGSNPPLSGGSGASLKSGAFLENFISRISQPQFAPLALYSYILLGAMESPEKAATTPGLETLLSSAMAKKENEAFFINSALLKILNQNVPEVSAQLKTLLRNEAQDGSPASRDLILFAAEFFYDHGEPLRAAELFSRFSDPASVARQADALWFAQEVPGARTLWTILAAPETETQNPTVRQIKTRSLYNLAATAAGKAEETALLERLFIQGENSRTPGESRAPGESPRPGASTGASRAPGSAGLPSSAAPSYDPSYIYGVIRYTRLLDPSRSAAILEDEALQNIPLIDLELLRRRRENWPPARTIPEVWLLLDRHPQEEQLYQWACYYFDRQRRHEESAQLVKTAGYYQINGPWLDLHLALNAMREGRLEDGEKILRAAEGRLKAWQIPANLGRIQEALRSPAAALDSYEKAAALVEDPKAASEIRFRISRCLRALGRSQESRRALEHALELDTDNLKARLELRRPSP